MSKSSSLLDMQRAITDYVKGKLPKDDNSVRVGRISGNNVIIQNRTYHADALADMAYSDNDRVYCLVPKFGNKAAIVGKV